MKWDAKNQRKVSNFQESFCRRVNSCSCCGAVIIVCWFNLHWVFEYWNAAIFIRNDCSNCLQLKFNRSKRYSPKWFTGFEMPTHFCKKGTRLSLNLNPYLCCLRPFKNAQVAYIDILSIVLQQAYSLKRL